MTAWGSKGITSAGKYNRDLPNTLSRRSPENRDKDTEQHLDFGGFARNCHFFESQSKWSFLFVHQVTVMYFSIRYFIFLITRSLSFQLRIIWALRWILNFPFVWKSSVFLLRRKSIKNQVKLKEALYLLTNCIGFCRCTFRQSLN